MADIFGQIGSPAQPPQMRGKSPGWPKGKPRQRKQRYNYVKCGMVDHRMGLQPRSERRVHAGRAAKNAISSFWRCPSEFSQIKIFRQSVERNKGGNGIGTADRRKQAIQRHCFERLFSQLRNGEALLAF